MAKRDIVLLVVLIWGCSEPKPLPDVVRAPPGAPRPLTIAGPMPHFGPFTNVSDAIVAACPFILSQPHAVMPVRRGDQNFDVYWRTAEEYCAWIYGVEGKTIEMSLLSANSVQSDPTARHCDLPPYVADNRYPPDSISHLIIIHNHPFDKELSQHDLQFVIEMAKLHGFTASLQGRYISISIIALIGQERAGKVTCSGYYRYFPARSGDVVKATLDNQSGKWREARLGSIRWNANGTYTLER